MKNSKTAEDHQRVTLHQIAAEIGRTPARTRRLLTRHAWVVTGVQGFGRRRTYDARVIERLHALLGQPHRQMEPPEKDWLSQYLDSKEQ